MVDAIEKKLNENQWLGGQAPGTADRESFDGLNGKVPDVAKHPSAFSWYCLVSKFTPTVRETWTGGASAAAGGKEKPAAGGKEKAAAGGKEKQPAAAPAKEETKQESKGGKKKGKKGKNAPKEEEKKHVEVVLEEPSANLDDMCDLFGSDDEEDLKAKSEAIAAAKEANKKKAAKKPAAVAKSLVILEVKPWGKENDLDKLGK